ncbi:FAD binding domain-containing protein [Flavilitoribacter nigricans]|uniref:Carbon monoxide dehydrogenase n=1 Tax=Flavilitoribacter nigricans (strain ATCC 23147 / DSM 23189 / NBRC 102662 / NCIMB 1420 / SS-2) TaxID=1122177 RepID=A0A2D0MZT7_FLAN2|nr:xanthine dehydrogenase family protein subunit M [Flavilitoribacter nigricans]PHN01690.1 carbon monoxide dehydrogenase [Flavilitoribacter nigricans DSM 23189 = NBRC 102662]
MVATSFDYQKATSVEQAISLLQSHDGDAKLLAGGHSLIPTMKLRLNSPALLIDVSKIEELRGIREEDGHIVIGAMTTHYEIASSDLLAKKAPMFVEAAKVIGDIQVRNKGTIGGSLAHADPAADWPAVVIASGAKIKIHGPDGARTVDADDFFTGFYTTAVGENDVLTSIHVPVPPKGSKSTYAKFPQPASRYALVGCAVQLTMDGNKVSDCSIGFTGVSDAAFRDSNAEAALKGKELSGESIQAAADACADGVDIMSDHFASEDYRKHLAGVFLKRALENLK